MERCKEETPVQREVEPGHYVVCHLYDDTASTPTGPVDTSADTVTIDAGTGDADE